MSELLAIREILAPARRALVATHIMPDGDAIASALGLAWALRRKGLEVRLACEDPVPAELRFLPGSEDFAPRTRTDEDVIIAVDCGDLGRLGQVYQAEACAGVPLVNIDHHGTNPHFGTVNWVQERSSTAELVLELVLFLGIPLDTPIATCLLTGILTDTRGFRTASTTAETLRAAMTLVSAGAHLAQIADAVFNRRPLEALRLWGVALALARHEDGILWVPISQEMLRSLGASDAAVSGLANFLSTFDHTLVYVVLHELADGRVDVNLRSRPGVNVAAVAQALGGGGHPQAAGCLLPGPLSRVEALVLDALRGALRRHEGPQKDLVQEDAAR